MSTLDSMKNKLEEFQVRTYALNWYSKSVLTDEDMTVIDGWFTAGEESEEITE